MPIDDDDFKRATTRKRRWHSATGEDPRGRGRAAEHRKEGGSWWCTGHRAVGREKKRGVCSRQTAPKPRPQATPMRAQCSAQTAYTAARAPPQSHQHTLGAQDLVRGVPPQPSPTRACAQTKQGKARVSSAKTKRGRVGETARARGYLRPRAAGYFYIAILARAAARGRRPEGCEAGSYRQNGPFGPLPKPKFGRGDGRLGDRPAVAPSGWRETAVPMRGHRHHSRIGRANALTGRHRQAQRLLASRATQLRQNLID